MSPIQRVTLGQGGREHEAADATIASFTGRRFEGKVAVVTGAGSGVGWPGARAGATPSAWPGRARRSPRSTWPPTR